MKADPLDGGGRDDLVEVAVDVPGFDGRPDPSSEDQPGLLPPVAGLLALGFFACGVFFQCSPLAAWGLWYIPMCVLPIVASLVKSRRALAWITIAYLPLSIVDTWISL